MYVDRHRSNLCKLCLTMTTGMKTSYETHIRYPPRPYISGLLVKEHQRYRECKRCGHNI